MGTRTTTAGLLTAAAALLAAAPAAHAATVVAFPSPDVRTASPRTTISVRGTTAAALRGIVVRGSRTGAHPGSIRAHADGAGASFRPSSPFASGERVTVRVPSALRVQAGQGRTYEFTTARIVGGFATDGASGAPRGRGGFPALRSDPTLAPPTLRSNVNAAGQEPGLIALAPKIGTGQGGPMLVDDTGEPRWFLPRGEGVRATDFRVQAYRGKPALTWWEGRARGGSGRGEGVIMDESYRVVKRVRMGNGLSSDLHEMRLTDRGTALLMSYVPVRGDLSSVGGPRRGIIVDGVLQEVELDTGLVRFEWHSIGQVPLSASNFPVPTSGKVPYDYFHPNSLNLDPSGGYVVSARYTSVYRLDDAGRIAWSLGGERTSRSLKGGPGTSLLLQHDALGYGNGVYTIFDNLAPGKAKKSRLLTIRVDEAQRTATLVKAVTHPEDVLAATQGNFQPLPGDHAFAGWGSQGRISELDAAGKLLLDLELPRGYDTYRAYRVAWTGRPAARPKVLAQARDGATAVYMSQNGATEIAAWRITAGASPSTLAQVADVPMGGLETATLAPTAARYVRAQALDATGAVLATSATERVAGR